MNLDSLKSQSQELFNKVIKLRVFIFALIVIVIYGYLLLRINTLKNPQPALVSQSSQSQATTHIDPALVNKINQLQDDSVSVQALFNQARQNPFQE